ncbi:hypothetical protein GCM10023093_02050 [Nemorincola caseinilytica]|uniref:Response regulatory domain-containing protein n=1 Tax=Nemorincola caseinilytica TaxID=2054315 RepID=A0ABP8N6C3_9BACT
MNEEIKILIIEDEAMWSENLSATLDGLGFSVAGIADTFEDAVRMMNNEEFDIALVDITLHHKNSGIELGKMLTNYYKKPYLFITANDDPDAMEEAVKARPSAYLTKPVDRKSLAANIYNAIYNFNAHISPSYTSTVPHSDTFFVKNGNKYRQLQWSNIVYLYSTKNYTAIFNAADNTEHYIRSGLTKTLSHIIPQHLRAAFAQVNRKEAVQLSHIREVIKEEIRTDHKVFTMSDVYATELKEKMNILT